MMMLIAYDVSLEDRQGAKRLRRIAKICEDYGLRVQFSLFECDITQAQWLTLKAKLLDTYQAETDSLRFYRLGKNWQSKIEHHGAKNTFDLFNDPLIL